jgi:hypothetical protein
MYIYYNGLDFSKIIYDDMVMDNKIKTLEMFNEAIRKANIKIRKEKFTSQLDQRQITQPDAINYYSQLENIQSWLNNNYYGENGILENIKYKLSVVNDIREKEKEEIINLLSNIYVIAYIDQINKANAESYKTYLKYGDIRNNPYYNQYLR